LSTPGIKVRDNDQKQKVQNGWPEGVMLYKLWPVGIRLKSIVDWIFRYFLLGFTHLWSIAEPLEVAENLDFGRKSELS
jgi:hypothetical protein